MTLSLAPPAATSAPSDEKLMHESSAELLAHKSAGALRRADQMRTPPSLHSVATRSPFASIAAEMMGRGCAMVLRSAEPFSALHTPTVPSSAYVRTADGTARLWHVPLY